MGLRQSDIYNMVWCRGGLSGTMGAVEGVTRGGGWELIRLSSAPMVFLAESACRRVATEGPAVAWATAGKSGTKTW